MNRPIRVLHILQRMEAGGTQALLMNIYRNIDRSKVQFDFLVEYSNKQFYDDEIESLGGKIFYTSFREDMNLLKFKKYLRLFFEKHNEYKIVHVHTYSIGYFCLKAAKKAGVPIRIAHSHNNETVHDYKYLLKLFMQKIYTIHATDLFACSEDAGKYLFGKKHFHVLKNSIDSEKYIANKDKEDSILNELNLRDKFVVGNVGRFHPQKNHDFLIEIFYEIKKIKENSVLLLVGSGPTESKIREKIREMQLDDSVIFLHNRRDMDRIYQAMDVFIFPSLFEGFGMVAMEAQASGIPTLCSEGIPDDMNVTPLFYRKYLKDSPHSWAEKAIELSTNPLSHTNMQSYIDGEGYDVKNVSMFLQNYYLKKYLEVTDH